MALAVVIGVGIHFAYPALAGLQRSVELLQRANLWWIGAALFFSALSLACYVAVFRYVVGDEDGAGVHLGWAESYQATMASQAASTVVTAGGAGGIAILFWVLVRGGLDRTQAAARIVAFLTYYYAIYLAALVVFGSLLWLGVFAGSHPAALTILPAALSGAAIVVVVLIAARPSRLERRLSTLSRREGRLARQIRRLVSASAVVAAGLRDAAALIRPRRRGATIVAFAVGYWTAKIAVLAACFEAFGEPPALAGLVQAFFVGMTANLLPLLPGGVGSVEAGLIGALLAFGEPAAEVVVSVLAYRLIGFWLPTIPEAIAYFQLRHTVAQWRDGGRRDLSAPASGPR